MALPSLQKSWQFDTNNSYTAAASVKTSYEQLLYAIKVVLTSFPTNPWTVVASSNTTVANTSDNWTSASSVVFGSGASNRSWIVLKQTGISSNFQLALIANNGVLGATGEYGMFQISPSAGFTGLTSTSVNPTATDQYKIQVNDYWTFFSPGAAFGFTIHGMQSTDGSCTRLVWCTGGQSNGGLIIDTMQSPVTGLVTPVAAFCPSNTHPTATNIWGNATMVASNVNLRKTTGPTTVASGFVTMHAGGTYVGAYSSGTINQISNEYPLMPMGVYSQQSGSYGFHGFIVDMWNGTTNVAATNGSTYPDDSTRQFVQFGNTVLPWDGSVVVLT